MTIGRGQRLGNALKNLAGQADAEVHKCIVTNERGLVVASLTDIGPSEEKIAAMASLLSETSKRILLNVEMGSFDSAAVAALQNAMLMHEFPVKGRPFRIIAIASPKKRSGFWASVRAGRRLVGLERGMRNAADEIRRILEE